MQREAHFQMYSIRTKFTFTVVSVIILTLSIAMVISGLVFLYFALDALTDRIYGVHGKR